MRHNIGRHRQTANKNASATNIFHFQFQSGIGSAVRFSVGFTHCDATKRPRMEQQKLHTSLASVGQLCDVQRIVVGKCECRMCGGDVFHLPKLQSNAMNESDQKQTAFFHLCQCSRLAVPVWPMCDYVTCVINCCLQICKFTGPKIEMRARHHITSLSRSRPFYKFNTHMQTPNVPQPRKIYFPISNDWHPMRTHREWIIVRCACQCWTHSTHRYGWWRRRSRVSCELALK